MTTAAPVGLHDTDLSAIYMSADATSSRGQKRTKFLIRSELISLIIASIAGVTTYRVGAGGYDILSVVSALFFLIALGCTLTRAFTRPEESWYSGRAAAESARTLGWRYAVGGAPFADGEPGSVINDRFLHRLRDVIEQLKDTDLGIPDSTAHEITPAMRLVRQQDVGTRRLVYKRDRINDQLQWYERRTKTHATSARLWISVVVASSAAGFVAAAFKFLVINTDLLGIFAACASAAIAWNQLNQHRNLVTAYAVTARELSIIRDRIDHVPDAEWADFVSDSEDAISREHTMWLARHGHIVPSGNPRS